MLNLVPDKIKSRNKHIFYMRLARYVMTFLMPILFVSLILLYLILSYFNVQTKILRDKIADIQTLLDKINDKQSQNKDKLIVYLNDAKETIAKRESSEIDLLDFYYKSLTKNDKIRIISMKFENKEKEEPDTKSPSEKAGLGLSDKSYTQKKQNKELKLFITAQAGNKNDIVELVRFLESLEHSKKVRVPIESVKSMKDSVTFSIIILVK